MCHICQLNIINLLSDELTSFYQVITYIIGLFTKKCFLQPGTREQYLFNTNAKEPGH